MLFVPSSVSPRSSGL